jgi:small subunit ribosomal protein S9
METIIAIGRRKSAVARIHLVEGKGKLMINEKEFKVYFPTPQLQYTVLEPLIVLDAVEKFDIQANLDGGGSRGQAEALRLAIARAMVKIDPTIKKNLKVTSLLTRDPREVERKKPGQKKARKRFQFSKR